MAEEREKRSGSDSNANKHRKASRIHDSNKAMKQPIAVSQQNDDFTDDLRPDNLAGEDHGRGLALEFGLSAYDVKELHDTLADLTDDELKEIPIVPIGSRLEQGAKYIDLLHLEQGEFVATAGMVPEEKNLVWTLGHVAVHTTASSEESAALALTLARGLTPEGRSRYEVPWRSVQTIDQVRHRFEESRRMRLAMLDAWPDEPHLEVLYSVSPRFGPFNATARFLMGLYHDDDHLGQLRELMRQAHDSRVCNAVHKKTSSQA